MLGPGNEEAARSVRRDHAEAWTASDFEAAMAPFLAQHERLVFEARTRKRAHSIIRKTAARRWEAQQVLVDPSGENLWRIAAEVDLTGLTNPAGPIIHVWEIGT